MKIKTTSKVIVYHDETGISSQKGHALLFIPNNLNTRREQTLYGTLEDDTACRKLIYNKIMDVRKNHDVLEHKFHFSKISGKRWGRFNTAERKMVDLGVDALKRKGAQKFNKPLCCKLAIIYYPSSSNLEAYYKGNHRERKLKYGETLLRMLLKGAVHLLYDLNNQVEILKIITDGEPYHRKISEDRVLQRLIDEQSTTGQLRPYVSIHQDAEIIPQSSDHKNHVLDGEEYINANMLQLVDMLLGSAIHSCYVKAVVSSTTPPIGCKVEGKKGIIASPVREMLDKKKERGAGFTTSSHYQSFSLSEAFFRNGEWDFREMTTKEEANHMDINQLKLFNCATQK